MPRRLQATHNYWEALELSLHFYDHQRSGFLPSDRRSCFRYHSFLNDLGNNNEDLIGGWFDAGDFVKFNLPMSASVTMLAYGGIYYTQNYKDANLWERLKDTIKWPLDYFIKCYINDKLVYGQCGNGDIDHAAWGRPEDSTTVRPCYELTDTKPGTEAAAGMAAALAAGYLIFKDDDPTYAASLLDTAKKMYTFGETYKGNYDSSIPDASKFYKSYSGYKDELVEGAALLYKATEDTAYLDKAKNYERELGNMWGQSWDEKNLSATFLLAELTGETSYISKINSHLSEWRNMSKVENVLSFRAQWGCLRYSANTSLLALMSADFLEISSKDEVINWAKSQIDFMLGSNSRNFSYLIGYGSDYPLKPHHSASSCPDIPSPCSWDQFNSSAPNPQVLLGALVGGPGQDGSYEDRRNDYIKNEVATDYNAGFTSALVRLFGSEQSVSDVGSVDRTCTNPPDYYIGVSASNYEEYANSNGESVSPDGGNGNDQSNTCEDNSLECKNKLTNQNICSIAPWDTDCKKSCCKCGECTETFVCVDYETEANCNAYKSNGLCSSDDTVKYSCQKTCGTCSLHPCYECRDKSLDPDNTDNTNGGTDNTDGGTDNTNGGTDNTNGGTDNTNGGTNTCEDDNDQCENNIKTWDMCKEEYWKGVCKKTCCQCSTCESNMVVSDYNSADDCYSRKMNGQCSFDQFTKYVCQKTCGTSEVSSCSHCFQTDETDSGTDESTTDECRDIDSDCANKVLSSNICAQDDMKIKCAKTCCECGCNATECKDYELTSVCEDHLNKGLCGTDDIVKYKCQKTCNTCSLNKCNQCDPGTDTTPPSPPPEETCEDISDECLKKIVISDICKDDYWRSQCKKSCCECECPETVYCVDYLLNDQCSTGKEKGYCESSEFFRYSCQHTCNTCVKNSCYKCTESPNNSSLNNTSTLPSDINAALDTYICRKPDNSTFILNVSLVLMMFANLFLIKTF